MELAQELKRRNLQASVEWTPRELNKEADALSKGDFTGFRVENRVPVDLATTSWLVPDRALEWGAAFEKEASSRNRETRVGRPGKRKRAEERLRVRDPW